VFSGTLQEFGRRRYIEGLFLSSVLPWISKKCFDAVSAFDYVRYFLLQIYLNLEKKFPDGHQRLSEKARAHQNGHHDAFPGGPEEDIYTPIHDEFLAGKHIYEPQKIELVSIDARGDEPADFVSGKRKRTSNDQAAESSENGREDGTE